MKYRIYFFLIMIYSTTTICQEKKGETLKNQFSNNKDYFELRLDVERLKNENLHQIEAAKKIETKLDTDLKEQKEDLVDRMNLYLFFIGLLLALIGFAINFFGKQAIKSRVEEIISDTIKKHSEQKISETLNSKITNDLIEATIKSKSQEEINLILQSLREDGKEAIKNLEEKGAEAIKLMLAAPPESIAIQENQPMTDEEITKQNNRARAREFFKIAYEKTENPRIKIDLYKNVLEIEPNNADALNNIAVSHINLNEPNEAIVALNKALEINPNYFKAYVNRAKAFNLQNKFEEALKDLDIAAGIDPKFEYIYSTKGNILTKQGKFEEAEVELNNSIQLNPNSPEAYFNRAFFYEERKEYSKSEADYKMAENLGAENKAALYNNMAVLYRRTKEFDKAIEYIEKARSVNPDYPNIDGTLALIYADKNDDENFYKHLQIALEKGCPAWNYITDSGFDKHRDTEKLIKLLEVYKKKYFA